MPCPPWTRGAPCAPGASLESILQGYTLSTVHRTFGPVASALLYRYILSGTVGRHIDPQSMPPKLPEYHSSQEHSEGVVCSWEAVSPT